MFLLFKIFIATFLLRKLNELSELNELMNEIAHITANLPCRHCKTTRYPFYVPVSDGRCAPWF